MQSPAAMAEKHGSTLTPRDFASLLGRNQGPELFFQQDFTPGKTVIIPQILNLNRPMERLHVIWRGRIKIGVANYTKVAAEAPQSIMQQIKVFGTHKRFSALTPIDLTGASAFTLPRLTRQRSCSLYINGVRQPEPTVPFQQIGATFGNVGTYDVEIHYDIPVTPILTPATKQGLAPFLWYADDWGDTLRVQLAFGDKSSFGTPGGATTVAFSSFGSDEGTPTVTIETNYEILSGALANAFASAVIVRNEQVSNLVNAGPRQRIQVLQKQKTLNVIIKSGKLLADTTGGVSVFETLTDNQLDITQINVDNKPVRNNFANFAQKEYAGFAFDTILPQGILIFPFDDSENPLTYYRGDLVAPGSTFSLDTSVLTSGAQQAQSVIQEQVFGDPDVKSA